MTEKRTPILVFFHGDALAHTIRPLVISRALAERGFPVVLAGRGVHTSRITKEGFEVLDCESMPQSRMDDYLAREDNAYYDTAWVERCVDSERRLIRLVKPALIVSDMKPTTRISASLEGADLVVVKQGYEQPGYPFAPSRGLISRRKELAPFAGCLFRHASEIQPNHRISLIADIPELHPPPGRGPRKGWYYVGPLHDRPEENESAGDWNKGWDLNLPLIYLTAGSSGLKPGYLGGFVETAAGSPFRVVITTAGRWTPSSLPENVRVFDYIPGEWVLSRAKILAGIPGIGAIYQALRKGVPIAAASEQRDHDLHINRLESLGLGIKLERKSLDAKSIFKGLDIISGSYGAFRARCAEFSEYLVNWDGGETAADIIEFHLQHRKAPRMFLPFAAAKACSRLSLHKKSNKSRL